MGSGKGPDRDTQRLTKMCYTKWPGGEDMVTEFREGQPTMRKVERKRCDEDTPRRARSCSLSAGAKARQ